MERPTSAGQRLAPIGATQGQSSDADAESIADKYFVCTECLIGGHVQSFIELFYLTHLTQQSAASIENQKASNEISSGTLHFLKQILTRAENSQRSGDLLAVVDSYKALAEHYEAEDDHRTALYFTEKCLEVSKLCGDKRAEVEANRLLGFCHEHLGNAELSLKHHEVQRDIARSLADSEEILDANRHLIDAYKSAAEQCERQGQYEKAVALHEQCMESSRASGDDLSAGLACAPLPPPQPPSPPLLPPSTASRLASL
jgi:tetratricopeptide (TPR) repeat protein